MYHYNCLLEIRCSLRSHLMGGGLNVINNNESIPNTTVIIENAKNPNRPVPPHIKPTLQPSKTVGIPQTDAAGEKRPTTPTCTATDTTLHLAEQIQKDHNNNHHNITHPHHTTISLTKKNSTQINNHVDSRPAIYIGAESPSNTKIQERRTPNTAWQPGQSQHLPAPTPQRTSPCPTGHRRTLPRNRTIPRRTPTSQDALPSRLPGGRPARRY